MCDNSGSGRPGQSHQQQPNPQRQPPVFRIDSSETFAHPQGAPVVEQHEGSNGPKNCNIPPPGTPVTKDNRLQTMGSNTRDMSIVNSASITSVEGASSTTSILTNASPQSPLVEAATSANLNPSTTHRSASGTDSFMSRKSHQQMQQQQQNGRTNMASGGNFGLMNNKALGGPQRPQR